MEIAISKFYETFMDRLLRCYKLPRNLFMDTGGSARSASNQGRKEMKTIILSNSLYMEKRTAGTALEFDLRKWRSSFVITAMLGGICGLIGLTLSVIHLFGSSGAYHFLDNVGAGFLVVALLLFSFAAHSLDNAHEAETTMRIDRCKRTGMKVDEEK
jgi:hypothetical protein